MGIIRDLISRIQRLWVPLAIGFLAIVYVAFGLVYFQQYRQQNSLDSEIAQIEAQMPHQTTEEIQAEINQAEKDLKQAQDIFPADFDEAKADVLTMFEKLAEQSSVTVVTYPRFSEGTEIVSGIKYRVLRYTEGVIKGDYEGVAEFIHKMDTAQTSLEQWSLKSLILTKVSLHFLQQEANLEFTVYALSGG